MVFIRKAGTGDNGRRFQGQIEKGKNRNGVATTGGAQASSQFAFGEKSCLRALSLKPAEAPLDSWWSSALERLIIDYRILRILMDTVIGTS